MCKWWQPDLAEEDNYGLCEEVAHGNLKFFYGDRETTVHHVETYSHFCCSEYTPTPTNEKD